MSDQESKEMFQYNEDTNPADIALYVWFGLVFFGALFFGLKYIEPGERIAPATLGLGVGMLVGAFLAIMVDRFWAQMLFWGVSAACTVGLVVSLFAGT